MDVSTWSENGYLRVEQFFDEGEVEDLSRWVSEVERSADGAGPTWHHREETDQGVRLSRSENFVPYHEGLRTLLTSGRVTAALAELFGEEPVLYKEKINYKYPGGGGYAAHQDAPAYSHVRHHITCLIPIDAATEESGCLWFAPGLHRRGLLDVDNRGCLPDAVSRSLQWVPAPAAAGDILFFSSLAPHWSGPNRTAAPRRVLYVTYNALSDGDWRTRYYTDKQRVLDRPDAREAGRISTIGHFQGKTIP